MANRLKLAFWKPRKNGGGAAALFEYNIDNQSMWLNMLPQKGTELRSFDYEKRDTAKLGWNDLGEILAVLNGHKDGAGSKRDDGNYSGLYHKSGEGDDNTVVSFYRYQDTGYSLQVSTKRGGQTNRNTVGITFGEGELLKQLIEAAVQNMIFDEYQASGNSSPTNQAPVAVDSDMPF